MMTPRLRTYREAVVASPTRITLSTTSAAVALGTTGRYSVFLSSMVI